MDSVAVILKNICDNLIKKNENDLAQIEELQVKYNKLLARHDNAYKYMEDNNISIAEKEKYLPEYQKLVAMLEKTIVDINNTGENMTDAEIEYGFTRRI